MALNKRKTHLNLSGSHHTLDSDNGFVGGTLFITGAISASAGITGSVRYVSNTTPFLVDGGNMGGVNYNSATGQWEITGSAGTSVAGLNTQLQFNADGIHGASSLLTFNTASVGSLATGTLSVPTGSFQTLSGTNTSTLLSDLGAASGLLIDSNVIVTKSLMLFDGVDPILGGGPNGAGGLILQNGAGFRMSSGSFSGESSSIFAIDAAGSAADKADVKVSAETFKVNGFDIVPLWNHATSSQGNPHTNLSGSLLSDNMPTAGVGLFDLNVVAADQGQANFGSWHLLVTMTSSNAGGVSVAGVTEVDNVLVGTQANSWDLNVNGSAIEVTGSGQNPGTLVFWMAKLSQKMILSSSGQRLY